MDNVTEIMTWLPRWGKVGEFLSILQMFPDYYDKERPDVYGELGFDKVGAMLDGKDALVETIRKNDLLKRSGHSSKMKAQAWRTIIWVTSMGLTFEHTRAMGGRCDENELVRTHSILGRMNAPILDWKNYAHSRDENKILRYWSSVEDVLTNREVEKMSANAILNETNGEGNRSEENENYENIVVDNESITNCRNKNRKQTSCSRLPDPKKSGFISACHLLHKRRVKMK